MRAKEHAEILLTRSQGLAMSMRDSTDEVFDKALTRVTCEYVLEFLREVQDAVKKTRTPEAMYGAFREGITKWKAVVRIVQEDYKGHPIQENYIGLFLAMERPDVFETLVNNRVFLGYTFSEKEKEVLAEIQQSRINKDFNDRIKWVILRLMSGLSSK